MKKALVLVPALLAAAVVFAAPSSARHWSSPPAKLVPTLDSRLAQLTLAGNVGALATARSQGFLVTQGKIRVIVQARTGHVAGARTAVRLAHGKVVIATGRLIEALVPPKALRQLAVSRHVARVRPVEAAAARTVTGLRMTAAELAATGSDAPVNTTAEAEAGEGQPTASFSPPEDDGGSEIRYYQYPSQPDPPAVSPRPGIPDFTAPSNPRVKPHYGSGGGGGGGGGGGEF